MLDYSCIMMYVLDRYHIMLHMIVYMPYLLLYWLDTWLICYIRWLFSYVHWMHLMIALLSWITYEAWTHHHKMGYDI